MCGICGIVSRNGSTPDKDLLRKMLDRLYHRGPDGRGWFRDRFAALGHTRLSIIDLEGGTQPLCNEDESLWISFNGEIYNYIELRDELISLGHVFRTNSDTEVIVHAWESWRENCFSRFNGQWAIALWDRKERELILSRDRHGIRPLYYTQNRDKFLFASEVKALFADSSIERAFSPEGLQEIFTFWGPVAPRSVFKGVFELPPGTFAVLKEKDLSITPYWSIKFSEAKKNNEGDLLEKAEELRDRLDRAVRLRFERSDVPVGAYLSGGIDSSITSSIVMKYARKGLKTFSLGFFDPQFDEGRYQKKMIDYLGSDHSSLIIDYSDIARIFPKVMEHAERPILRTAPAPLFMLSQLVKDSGYKVVVTGEGADEVLGGYDIFREAFIRNKVLTDGQTPETENLLKRLYPWMGDKFQSTPAFTKSFFSKNLIIDDPGISHRPRWDNTKLLYPIFTKDFAEFSKSSDIISPLLNQLPSDSINWSYLQKAQWLEYTTLLFGYILSAQGDRMLMANSIEGRFPFLDVDLDEFSNGLNSEYKLRSDDMIEKYILKEAYRNDIPREILERPKQPYQSPNGVSFIHNFSDVQWLNEIREKEFVESTGIFDSQAIMKLFQKASTMGNEMSFADNTRVISFISTMLIHKQFIIDNEFDSACGNQLEAIFDFAQGL